MRETSRLRIREINLYLGHKVTIFDGYVDVFRDELGAYYEFPVELDADHDYEFMVGEEVLEDDPLTWWQRIK